MHVQCRVSTVPATVEGIHYLLARISLIISHSWGMIYAFLSMSSPCHTRFLECLHSTSVHWNHTHSYRVGWNPSLLWSFLDSCSEVISPFSKILRKSVSLLGGLSHCITVLFYRRFMTMYFSSWQVFSFLNSTQSHLIHVHCWIIYCAWCSLLPPGNICWSNE